VTGSLVRQSAHPIDVVPSLFARRSFRGTLSNANCLAVVVANLDAVNPYAQQGIEYPKGTVVDLVSKSAHKRLSLCESRFLPDQKRGRIKSPPLLSKYLSRSSGF
jgi:hypothetical protein